MIPEQYGLTSASLVFDVGAHVGRFSLNISRRFGCRILAFEPMPDFWDEFIAITSAYTTVELFKFGLLDEDKEADLVQADDRTSLYLKRDGNPRRVVFRDIVGFMDERGITEVDLMKLNTEGGEYPLMRRLIDTGKVAAFRHLLVQFHDFIPQAHEMYEPIATDLQRTHTLTRRQPFVWETWGRKD